MALNKELGAFCQRPAPNMKRIISIIILAILIALALQAPAETEPQTAPRKPQTAFKLVSGTSVGTKLKPLTEPKKAPKLTWRDNPYNCDLTKQWIRADNFKCIPIPQTAIKTQPTIKGGWVAQCKIWAKEAGITWSSAVQELIDLESDCNPTIWNYNGSGACGIPQALPCSKLPNGINTLPIEQLKWMKNYVLNKYGSWSYAVYFWHYVAPTINGQHWY